jgi:hypothetical protein
MRFPRWGKIMGPVFRYFIRSTATTVSLLLAFTTCANAQQCQPPGCPAYSNLNYALPTNTNVAVQFPQGLPFPIFVALDNAINRVNGQATANGSGTTFSVVYGPSSGPTINLTIDQTSTASVGPCGAGNLGCLQPPSTGVIQSANIYIGLAIQDAAGNPWFNESISTVNYLEAITFVMMHELYHGLGNGDTASRNSINSPVLGVNNSGLPAQVSPCDNQGVVLARNNRNGGRTCTAP